MVVITTPPLTLRTTKVRIETGGGIAGNSPGEGMKAEADATVTVPMTITVKDINAEDGKEGGRPLAGIKLLTKIGINATKVTAGIATKGVIQTATAPTVATVAATPVKIITPIVQKLKSGDSPEMMLLEMIKPQSRP